MWILTSGCSLTTPTHAVFWKKLPRHVGSRTLSSEDTTLNQNKHQTRYTAEPLFQDHTQNEENRLKENMVDVWWGIDSHGSEREEVCDCKCSTFAHQVQCVIFCLLCKLCLFNQFLKITERKRDSETHTHRDRHICNRLWAQLDLQQVNDACSTDAQTSWSTFCALVMTGLLLASFAENYAFTV